MLACSDAGREVLPPPPSCKPAPGRPCTSGSGVSPAGGPGAGGGTTGTGSTGGAGGAGGDAGAGGATAATVVGTVQSVNTASFLPDGPYAEPATIVGEKAEGGLVEARYGGLDPTTFQLDGLKTGDVFLLVRDETNGASGVLSTITGVRLPASEPIVLPVLQRSVLQAVYQTLSSAPLVNDGAGHVVLRLTRKGFPLKGVTLTSGVSADAIAYDAGAEAFADDQQGTGPLGLILVANAVPSITPIAIELRDVTGTSFIVNVPVAAGSATLASFAL